jgi:hypothetical protein
MFNILARQMLSWLASMLEMRATAWDWAGAQLSALMVFVTNRIYLWPGLSLFRYIDFC